MKRIFEKFEQADAEVAYFVLKEVALECSFDANERSLLVFPRDATRCETLVTTAPAAAAVHSPPSFSITASQFAFFPAGSGIHIKAMGHYGKVFVLRPSVDRMSTLATENHLIGEMGESFQSLPAMTLPLSRWLDDLIDRHDFERRLNEQTPGQCSYFLEKQILNEFVRIALPGQIPTTGEILGVQHDDVLGRAVKWMEVRVFEPVSVDDMARHVGLGPSQFTRVFQAEFGCGPMAFLGDLRLEFAARHLERGNFNSSDLAHLCQFSELSAFSRAFKRKFGVSPTAYAKRSCD